MVSLDQLAIMTLMLQLKFENSPLKWRPAFVGLVLSDMLLRMCTTNQFSRALDISWEHRVAARTAQLKEALEISRISHTFSRTEPNYISIHANEGLTLETSVLLCGTLIPITSFETKF